MKVINVEKATEVKILENEEIKTMIGAFGCNYGDSFDITKLRYHKIIILADADIDGCHIATLLLTFFFRFMPELIINGNIYLGMTPLYKCTFKLGKIKEIYFYSDEEMQQYKKENKTVKFQNVQRYKGLGELNAEQLQDAAFNPNTRKIIRIDISDIKNSDKLVATLMGNAVEKRKELIIKKAKFANLDI